MELTGRLELTISSSDGIQNTLSSKLKGNIDLTETGGEDGLRHQYLLNSEESSQSDRSREESSFEPLHGE